MHHPSLPGVCNIGRSRAAGGGGAGDEYAMMRQIVQQSFDQRLGRVSFAQAHGVYPDEWAYSMALLPLRGHMAQPLAPRHAITRLC